MNQSVLPELTIVDTDLQTEPVSSTSSDQGQANNQPSATPELVNRFLTKLSKASSEASNQDLVDGMAETACQFVGFGPLFKALSAARDVA